MLATVLHAPGDVPLRGGPRTDVARAHRRDHQARGYLRLRLGSLALSRPAAGHRGPANMGHEYWWRGRRGRQRGHER